MAKPWNYNRYMDCIVNPGPRYSPRDKMQNVDNIIGYMLTRCQSMFRYEGLPDSIPQRSLELYLQANGNTCIAEYQGTLYAFTGGMGGEPDPYYMPTIYTVANPALNMSRMYRIGEDCVVIPNDSIYMGLLPLFSRYASSLVEAELSLHVALVNSRLVDLITAGTDKTKLAADKIISDVEDGKLAVILDKSLDGTLKALPYSQVNTRTLTELIEVIQYTKASWYNEIGLNANYNMKRESLNSTESQLNDDALLPLIDDMLRCRERGIEAVNAMFSTNIRVGLASAWEDNQEETDLEQAALADGDQAEDLSNQSENEDERKEDDNVPANK